MRAWMLGGLVALAVSAGHAQPTSIVGRVQETMVMDQGHTVARRAHFLWPADPEAGWALLKHADHPSQAPALELEGYTGPIGERVRVTGEPVGGDTIRVQAIESAPLAWYQTMFAFTGLTESEPEVARDITTGALRGIIILAGWADKPLGNGVTTATAADAFRRIVKPDLEANAYQRATWDFDVVDAGVLSGTSHCRFLDLVREAVDIVDPRVDFSAYATIAVLAPTSCWGGIAGVCQWSYTTVDGTRPIGLNWDTTSGGPDHAATVAVHEIGHNQCGLHCKLRIDAAGLPPFLRWGSLTISEYGSNLCALGNINPRCQFSCPVQIVTGALRPEEVQLVTESGDYPLATLETVPAGVKCLRIQRGGGPMTDLYVERRAPVPGTACAAAAAGSEFADGLGLLLSFPDLDGPVIGGPIQIDPYVPLGSPSSWSGALRPGRPWTDAVTGSTLEALPGGGLRYTRGPNIDLTSPTLTWNTPTSTVLRMGSTIAVTVGETMAATVRLFSQNQGESTRRQQDGPPGAFTVATNVCAAPATATTTVVALWAIDPVGNVTQQSRAYPIDRTGCGGGGTTSTSTSTTRVTTSSTTTTSDPQIVYARRITDIPDPSSGTEPIEICAEGVRGDVTVNDLVEIYQGVTAYPCRTVVAPTTRICCTTTVPVDRSVPLAIFVRSAQWGWSPKTDEPHTVGVAPTSSTTTTQPTTSTIATTSSTTTSTSSSSSSSSAPPTTRPPPTTTTVPPVPPLKPRQFCDHTTRPCPTGYVCAYAPRAKRPRCLRAA